MGNADIVTSVFKSQCSITYPLDNTKSKTQDRTAPWKSTAPAWQTTCSSSSTTSTITVSAQISQIIRGEMVKLPQIRTYTSYTEALLLDHQAPFSFSLQTRFYWSPLYHQIVWISLITFCPLFSWPLYTLEMQMDIWDWGTTRAAERQHIKVSFKEPLRVLLHRSALQLSHPK